MHLQRAAVPQRGQLGADPVQVVEVTRAANSFGATHLGKIREAFDGIADIVRDAQRIGAFRTDVDPGFAAMTFYGAIEQVLTGWIFGVLEASDAGFEEAKAQIVDTICGGLDAAPPQRVLDSARR